jgi:hypothetical protein
LTTRWTKRRAKHSTASTVVTRFEWAA